MVDAEGWCVWALPKVGDELRGYAGGETHKVLDVYRYGGQYFSHVVVLSTTLTKTGRMEVCWPW